MSRFWVICKECNVTIPFDSNVDDDYDFHDMLEKEHKGHTLEWTK